MVKLIQIRLQNPFNVWHKARKYFKFPKVKLYICHTMNGYPLPVWRKNLAKILDIDSHDVYWKDKWNSPRFEYPPVFKVIVFMWLEFGFILTYKEDTLCWESILDYVYYEKCIKDINNSNIWLMRDNIKLTPYNFCFNKKAKKIIDNEK